MEEMKLTPAQKAGRTNHARAEARKARRADGRKSTAPVNRTRKENPIKRAVITSIAECLQAHNPTISNAEKAVDFTIDGVSYTVTLTAHRAKK